MSDHFAHISNSPIWGLLSAVLLVVASPTVAAQNVDIRTLEESAEGAVIEFSVDWPTSMREAADSASIATFDVDAARALSHGLPTLSETVGLPSLRTPTVTLLAGDYDEIDLPTGDTLVSGMYAGEIVWTAGLGSSRNRPVVSVGARILVYRDGTVRRYRRIRVAVSFGAPSDRPSNAGMSVRPERRVAAQDNPHLAITQSALADGVVYKIPVTREGMYRIDRAFIAGLPDLTLSPDDIDPANIRVYGNGGAPVPASNAAHRKADLVENAAFRIGAGDGSFDAGDAVIFYGAGPSGWIYDEDWNHYTHPFAAQNYYFLKITNEAGASVGTGPYPGYSDTQVFEHVRGRRILEFDEFMWSKENGTGHTWVTNTIRLGDERTLIDGISLPGRMAGAIDFEVRAAIRSNPIARLYFESGGSIAGFLRAGRSVSTSETAPIAVPGTARFSYNVPAAAPLSLSMYIDPDALNAPEAAVDWIRLFYPQQLTASGDSLRFATPGGETGRFEFVLRGFTAPPHVWDVTIPEDIRRLGVQSQANAHRVQVQVTDAARPRELVAFLPANATSLRADQAQRVPNQNLHAPASYPDFVIVVPDAFRSAAEELAAYRRADGLNVIVADIGAIYNEFSGGLQDVRGLRDYLRFLYDRGNEAGTTLKYALLFGDGHFNYRNLGSETQQAELTNWILPYETEESYDPNESYTSDDYYALLDEDEGTWDWPGQAESVGTERVDIGIGRFPVQTPEEAAVMVEKIKHYESPATYGPWRTRYLFVADDGYNGVRPEQEFTPDLHTQNADVVAELIDRDFPWMDIRKIYGISYTREFLNGWRLPGAERDIQSQLNDGVLVMNYSGHGGEFSLAQEDLLTKEDALALRNYDRMPIFITATCSFGWWDLGDEQSAAEALLLSAEGGSIALMTTVRLVYTSSGINTLNVGLNRALNREMFLRTQDGRARRLGDILVDTKNSMAGLQGNNRKFNLLGDPTLRVGFPEREAVVESVNGTPVFESPSLRALEEVTVSGSIRTLAGTPDSGFDGQVSLTIFDAERRVELAVRAAMPRDYYTVREDLIWRGIVPARSGQFEATFIVPKDISYSDQPGRISAYAHNAESQAAGFTEEAIVGGTAANPPDDQEGPEITLFLNDTTFVSGGLTPKDPRLIVKLLDASGINTVGAGVGHEMLLVVDGDEQNAVDISGRFESDPGSFRSGRVTFPFEEYAVDLTDGPHTLSVRAWDVINNSQTEVLDFFVSSSADVVLQNVYNYPNPTRGETRFVFEHNQPTGTAAGVQIRIYTLAGRPVRTIESDEALPSGILTAGPVQVPWDGRDEDLNVLASGIYLYKVRVTAEGLDGERHVSERIEKLAIIR